jgi:hypothetical protein
MYKFVMFAGLGLASLVGLYGVGKVPAASVEQARAKYREGGSVWIHNGKQWYRGTVKQVGYIGMPRKATYLVSYAGHDWDEWVFDDRLRAEVPRPVGPNAPRGPAPATIRSGK